MEIFFEIEQVPLMHIFDLFLHAVLHESLQVVLLHHGVNPIQTILPTHYLFYAILNILKLRFQCSIYCW